MVRIVVLVCIVAFLALGFFLARQPSLLPILGPDTRAAIGYLGLCLAAIAGLGYAFGRSIAATATTLASALLLYIVIACLEQGTIDRPLLDAASPITLPAALCFAGLVIVLVIIATVMSDRPAH